MPRTAPEADDFFKAEFGSKQLSSRLWRGGLRASENGYRIVSGPRVLSNALSDALDATVTDGTVEAIINELETCWNDTARLRRACQPISLSSPALASALSFSLVKVILSIDVFQPAIITCVINKISEFADDANSDRDVARMLLNQLKWLDFIVDGPALCESLLAIVPIINTSMQTALIESLPEILDDSAREPAVAELIRILEETPSMMGSVVDTLGALGVDEERVIDVNSSILTTLAAANRDILPASLRYLLRTCPSGLLSQTVNALRTTLALPGLGPGAGGLCLDAVRAGLRMNKNVADHVLKMMRNLENPTDHKPADLWILIALLESPMHRKPAEMVFKKKAATNAFSNALLDAALAPFGDAFASLTDRLISMASLAVRSQEISARRMGVFMYSLLFRLFSHGNTRRNVVTALLDHTGTRRPHEIDAALEALALIAKEAEDNRSLLPHSALIQGLLDYIEHFEDSQLRQIWTVLGYLCRASSARTEEVVLDTGSNSRKDKDGRGNENSRDELGEDEGESELAMLEILLRKELTHADTFYRRIGVLGACTMIKVLGSRVKNKILSMLLEVGRSHPFSQALAFDELAEVFSQSDSVPKETALSIRKTISSLFEKKYITERAGLGSLTKEEELLPAKLFGNLEGDDVEFCFSISAQIRNEKSLKESQDAVRVMVPNLRLLCVLTAGQFDGCLDEVDAIIGAPLHIPSLPQEKDVTEIPKVAQYDLLLSLFVAHGWLVELVNAFAEQESSEIRAKCIRRLDNLLDVTTQMSACASKLPVWSEAVFDSYHGTRNSTLAHRKSAPGDQNRAKSVQKGKRSKEGGSARNPISGKASDWKKFARQLSPSALSLIRITDPVTWRYTETESEFAPDGDPKMETVVLSPKGLLYLMTEFAGCLDKLVGNDFKDVTAFVVSVMGSASTATKGVESVSVSEASTDGPLKRFRKMKTALTALGPQLSRILDKVFPADEVLADEDSNVELYQKCAMLCLQCVAVVLNAAALSDIKAQDVLFDVLASIRLNGDSPIDASNPLTKTDIEVAAKSAFKQLQKSLTLILDLNSDKDDDSPRSGRAKDLGFEGCAAFLAAIDSAFLHCSEQDQKAVGSRLSKAAHGILQYGWDPHTLKSKKVQKLIPGIVKMYVQYSNEPFSTAEKLRNMIVKFSASKADFEKKVVDTQCNENEEDGKSLGSLTAYTCSAFIIAILQEYLGLFKSFRPKNFENEEDAFERMLLFMKAKVPLYTLARQNQEMLGPVMRAGRGFVDLFQKSCLPFLKDNFRSHRSTVIQLCKTHQKSTRILQSFCAHSKYMRDTSLTGLVPPLRKSLELLLYRVKDLLQTNNATEAFQLGNLKHRDINGEVLNSQDMQYKSDSAGDSGEEADTDADNDEKESQEQKKRKKLEETESRKGGSSKLSRLSGQQTKKRPKSVQGQSGRKATKKVKVEEKRSDLDFGSDANGSEVGDEMFNVDEMDDTDIALLSSMQAVLPKGGRRERKRRKRRVEEDDEGEEFRGHPLIDNEADDDGEEEDDGNVEDLSQFIVNFGEEEEGE